MLVQEGADINLGGASAKTAVHKAVLLGRPDYVEYLLQRGASSEIRDFQVVAMAFNLFYFVTVKNNVVFRFALCPTIFTGNLFLYPYLPFRGEHRCCLL